MIDSETLSFAGDFPGATQDDWRRLVDAALKGAPFARLESRTYDGLVVEPLYGRATAARALAGRTPGAAWTLLQRVDHPDPAVANAQARDDLENGASGLMLVFAGSVGANGFGLDGSEAALARALDGVQLDAISIDLDLSAQARHAVRSLADLITRQGLAPSSVDLRTGFTPIGAFAASGRSTLSWNEMSAGFAAAVTRVAHAGFRGPFAVADGRAIHNAGGSEAQELAFALASAVAYLRALEAGGKEGGMTLDVAREAIYFRLAADADQFLTMAKFRAARKLWARIEAACGLAPKPILLAAETAWRMMTRHDPYVNVLRTTIAVTAAGLGGADTVTVLPHTAPFGLPDAFARRIARNTQLVLLEESNLARVADPAAGSGAIEALTAQLCDAAWSAFQEIERSGGAWAALEAGLIQRNVAAVCAERQKAVARGKDVLTGTNAFPDIAETAPAVLDVAPRPSPDDLPAAVTAAALPRLRLAEPFEQLRERSDKILAETAARPKIFLATLGAPADFNARVAFAKNFFAIGGIEAVSSPGPDFAPVYKSVGTALACLCSSDKLYEKDAAAAAQALRAAGAKQVYLAGRPGERETLLRGAGVQSFIYDGCDALATLTAAYDILSH
jgi:methylmalonyl-CoA mutase